MFGLAERGRLSMYKSTLNQAKADASSGESLMPVSFPMALMSSLSLTGEAAKIAAGRPSTFQIQTSLGATIEAIPSALLPYIDGLLVRHIKPPGYGQAQTMYQAQTLLNGLIFVRIVEVSRPKLLRQAHEFRNAALLFAEPYFAKGVELMEQALKDQQRPETSGMSTSDPKLLLANLLAELGIEVDPSEDDNQFCISATTKLNERIIQKAGALPIAYDDPSALTGGLFAFAIASALTQKSVGTFEIVATVAAGNVFRDFADSSGHNRFIQSVISAFNSERFEASVSAIATTTLAWVCDPSDTYLNSLAELFGAITCSPPEFA